MALNIFFAIVILTYWLLYRIPVIIRKKVHVHLVKKKRLNVIGELPLAISLVFYGYLTFLLIYHSPNLNTARLIAAILVFLTSAIFNEWSRVVLGKQWSGAARILTKHRLITYGPYSLVRHPMYLANLVMMLSGLTIIMQPLMIVLFAANLAILIHRSRIEDEELLREFGEEYKRYQKNVRRLIPFLY